MPEQTSNSQNESFWSPARILATAIVVALISTIGYKLFFGQPEIDTKSKVVLPGSQASKADSVMPPDFEVKTMDGGAIKLSNYRGKVVVVDFWATWCPPCREEVPQLVRLTDQNRARGMEVIGLHIDDQGRSTPDDIRKFIKNFSINYTVGMAPNEMFTAYLGTADDTIPQTVVFDRNGRAVAHFIGYDRSHAQELDEVINRALAGS